MTKMTAAQLEALRRRSKEQAMQDELKATIARAMAKADGYALTDEPIVAPEDDGFTPPRLSLGNAVAMYSHLIEAAWNTRADPALAAAQAEVARLTAENERLKNPMNYEWVWIEDEGYSDPYDAADSKDLEPGDLLEVTACRQIGTLWVAQIDNKNVRYFRTEAEARAALVQP